MGIYIFTLFLVFFLWIVMSKFKFSIMGAEKLENKNKVYVICIGTWLFFVAALRNYTVGADVYNYLSRYVRFAASEWEEIFVLADNMMFEYGFAIINKLLSYVNSNPRFFLVLAAFVVVFSFSRQIYENSAKPWLSFFMFITLGMFGESLSALRQYIAIVLILFSYNAIKKNKLMEFVILVLLAFTIHRSAFIVLPMFWISKIEFRKIHIGIIMGAGAFVFVNVISPNSELMNDIVAFLTRYTTYARFFISSNYRSSGGSVGATLIYFSFLILILAKLYNSDIESRNMYIAFAIASVALILCTFITGICERILPYFSAMFIFSVPDAIMKESNFRIQIQYISVICAVLLFYYFAIICRADVYQLIPYELWNKRINMF